MQSGLIASVALNYSSSFTLKCFWFPSVSDYGAESSCALQIVSLIIHTLMWVRLGCISECGNSKHMMTSLNSKNSMCKLTKGLSLKSYYQILSSSECWQCVFDLIREPQKTGSLISLFLEEATHCLHRKCLYLKIPYLMAPAATDGEIVFVLLEVSVALAVCKFPILILFCGIWWFFQLGETVWLLLHGAIGLESGKVGRNIADALYFAHNWEAGNNMDIKLRTKCSSHFFRSVVWVSYLT